MKKIKAIILSNELPNDHLLWVKACEKFKEQLEYHIVNLTQNNWLDEIQSFPFEIFLAKPPGLTALFKQLYDERIYILGKVLNYEIFPSPEEIFIYENKRLLSFWCKANGIPHPSTHVFYSREEAESFINTSNIPLVAKTNIGASGSGVKILHDIKEITIYIQKSFSQRGAPKRIGPNLDKGGLLKRGFHYVFHPTDIPKKLSIYKSKCLDRQAGFVILQEYIPHSFEWRVVRIGDSFFAHKKLKLGEKASGSLKKGYDKPPLALLDFVKNITDRHQFFSQAIDIFETGQGYLVNEMQCIFGQSESYQMLVNGKPGRYRFIEGKWTFEEGDFARNQCYDLRIEFLIEKCSKSTLYTSLKNS